MQLLYDPLPMHTAAGRAAAQFAARPISIRLVPRAPDDPPGLDIAYQIRLLTRGRQVIDVRMDAVTGRIVELRGADLAAARRK